MVSLHLSFVFRTSLQTNFKRQPATNRCKYTRKLIPMTASVKEITGIFEIASKYDCVLLDQFGVIHDGKTPYPNAINAINKLSDSGVKIIILSNSSKQSHHAAEKLRRMGVDTNKITGIITSGQMALGKVREYMSNNEDAHVLHFNWGSERGCISLSLHNIHQVAPVKLDQSADKKFRLSTVDFVLAHGTDGISTRDGETQKIPLSTLRELCATLGRERPDIPFFCANPDMVTVDGGTLRVMPGSLAEDFENAGGRTVHRLGKPDEIAYRAAEEMVDSPNRIRFLAIGDSLAHDILGAANMCIDSLYIAGGINAEDFGIDAADGFGELPVPFRWNDELLTKLIEKEAGNLGQRRPTYITSFFRW